MFRLRSNFCFFAITSHNINLFIYKYLNFLNNDDNYYSYDKLREELIPYVRKMGYTKVEFFEEDQVAIIALSNEDAAAKVTPLTSSIS